MAKITITTNGPLMDGQRVVFKAPCDCTQIDYLKVLYVVDGTQTSKLFTMKDAHGNTLTGLGNLFAKNSYVHAILDTLRGYAYLQNANTNTYLENKFNDVVALVNKLAGLFGSIHVWQKCTGTAEYSVVETGVTNEQISYYNPASINMWDVVKYADSYRIVSGKIELINPTTITLGSTDAGAPIIGKYIYSEHKGAYYSVPTDAAVKYNNPTYGSSEYITVTKATKLTVNITELDGGEDLGYVYSTDASTYPENGNLDGYLYYYLGTVDKALNR